MINELVNYDNKYIRFYKVKLYFGNFEVKIRKKFMIKIEFKKCFYNLLNLGNWEFIWIFWK